MHETLISHRHPEMRPNASVNSEGGDVVSVRVVRVGSEGDRLTGFNIVEEVIEPTNVTGDCFYHDRGAYRPALYRYGLGCTSLLAKGWEWNQAEFIKRP